LPVALAPSMSLQNAERIGIHQHGEAVVKTLMVWIHQNGALAFDASTENPAQAEQRAAAANFTGLATAVADDFAVGAQDRFHQGNGT